MSRQIKNAKQREIDLVLERMTVTRTEPGWWWDPFKDREGQPMRSWLESERDFLNGLETQGDGMYGLHMSHERGDWRHQLHGTGRPLAGIDGRDRHQCGGGRCQREHRAGGRKGPTTVESAEDRVQKSAPAGERVRVRQTCDPRGPGNVRMAGGR